MLSGIENKIREGKRLSEEDALILFRSDDIFTLGRLAREEAEKKNLDHVYYVRNIHINPTNICVNRCRFCAFSRSKRDEGAYELTIQEILEKLRKKAPYFDEVHIVGGLHPDWPFEHYLAILKSIKKEFPWVSIKAFTAAEIDYMKKISGLPIEEVLSKLKKAGLDLMPGGGAEIFHAEVRGKLCPEKLSGQRWLEVMRDAHRAGIKTNATMLYGHIEKYEHRVDHLAKIRALQDESTLNGNAGFQAFIPLPYQPKTEIGGCAPSGIEDLKCIAVSRLFLDNIPHIKAYWVMLGEKLSQAALFFGADDLEGTVMEEKIAHMAGARSKEAMSEEELKHIIRKAGKTPVRRDSFYRRIDEAKQKRSA
jgi:aminodeoxyfutalosine synthase